jgi:hypothetical protein
MRGKYSFFIKHIFLTLIVPVAGCNGDLQGEQLKLLREQVSERNKDDFSIFGEYTNRTVFG